MVLVGKICRSSEIGAVRLISISDYRRNRVSSYLVVSILQ
jgi:hypothetical protein